MKPRSQTIEKVRKSPFFGGWGPDSLQPLFRFTLPLLLLALTGCAYSSEGRHRGTDQEVENYENMCLLRIITAPPADQAAILSNCSYYINYYNWKRQNQ